MQASQLARRAGVAVDTVRFYTKQGLLKPLRNPNNGYQMYDHDDYQRLVFARKARQLGFSLKDIQEILSQAAQQNSPCPMVRELFERHLEQVEQQLRDLHSLRERMRSALAVWETMPDGSPDSQSICQLIERWDEFPLPPNLTEETCCALKKELLGETADVDQSMTEPEDLA
ncbi:MAG: MerR family DNA-binding protein [Hahellaceae bacterium]|nr:MerR family DNA-binding protein [Hahellaceae bacterium]